MVESHVFPIQHEDGWPSLPSFGSKPHDLDIVLRQKSWPWRRWSCKKRICKRITLGSFSLEGVDHISYVEIDIYIMLIYWSTYFVCVKGVDHIIYYTDIYIMLIYWSTLCVKNWEVKGLKGFKYMVIILSKKDAFVVARVSGCQFREFALRAVSHKNKFFHAEIARKKKVANIPTTHGFCLWNFSNSIFTHAISTFCNLRKGSQKIPQNP